MIFSQSHDSGRYPYGDFLFHNVKYFCLLWKMVGIFHQACNWTVWTVGRIQDCLFDDFFSLFSFEVWKVKQIWPITFKLISLMHFYDIVAGWHFSGTNNLYPMGYIALVATTCTQSFSPLQLIWKSGIRGFHLRALDIQMNCSDLRDMRGYQNDDAINGRQAICSIPYVTPPV